MYMVYITYIRLYSYVQMHYVPATIKLMCAMHQVWDEQTEWSECL